MRSLFFWTSILLLSGPLAAQQKVGIVLSGGGAKGIAHVGVLKALEENEIPIDYIVGTSMGGIIGGCYAAGMSPDQIEDMILSKEFLDWVNGRFDDDRSFYYRNDDNPSFIRLNLSLDSTFSILFNTSIANDLSLNFALAEKLAQPSAIARNNFDSLFVPLRVVAADIFMQKEVVLDTGLLSDALRATQTVPFFYQPIRVNGKYLFDGGVYNNFPVDVAEQVFKPDVIIGSNVSTKVFKEYPYGEDDKLISRSLLYMLLDKSDPARIPPSGVYIQPDISPFTSFDFGKARALIDSGYAQTIRQMPEIMKKVSARRSCDEVARMRNIFNNKTSPLLVQDIHVEGYSRAQQKYITKFFIGKRDLLTFSEVKSGFYNLVSDDYFNNLYPSFTFNPENKNFSFNLYARPQNNFQVDFGGVIATRNISNIFLGLNYYLFRRSLTHAEATFVAGSFYKSAQTKARIDLPGRSRIYIEPEATFNSWDYLQSNDWLVTEITPTVLNRIDRKMGVGFGLPVGNRFKLLLESAYLHNRDQYINTDVLISSDTLDLLRLTGNKIGLSLQSNTLNRKQYASAGQRIGAFLDWYSLREYVEPGSTSLRTETFRTHHYFFRAKFSYEHYFIKRGLYRIGYLWEGVFSNQPAFSSFRASVINAAGFYPIQDSRTLMLENFRAFNYVAGGMRHIFQVRKSIDFRLEGYLFKPIQSLRQGPVQDVTFESRLSDLFFAGSASLVLHSTVGPVCLSVNYYDDKQNQLGVLLHVGYLLFRKPSLE
jgi:NTE family protein